LLPSSLGPCTAGLLGLGGGSWNNPQSKGLTRFFFLISLSQYSFLIFQSRPAKDILFCLVFKSFRWHETAREKVVMTIIKVAEHCHTELAWNYVGASWHFFLLSLIWWNEFLVIEIFKIFNFLSFLRQAVHSRRTGTFYIIFSFKLLNAPFSFLFWRRAST
jgi:hypothetical protein